MPPRETGVVIGLTILAGRKGDGPADIPASVTLTAPARSGRGFRLF